MKAESQQVSEISFPGTGRVSSDGGQASDPEVTALYEAHALALIRLAYVILGDRPTAEDVVQEAFLGLCKRWGHLRDTASAPGGTSSRRTVPAPV